jgi:dTDP-4-amino-4,6-dideoxygalactose transaminase
MQRNKFLSFSPPALSELEVAEVVDTLTKGDWLSSGPKVKLFEEEFAKYVKAPAALALNSCTAGLHIGMLVHGIKPGDEVITTPMTFCATANVVEHVGGTVVLADVDPETLLISPSEIAKRITSKTKLLLPVHYAGQPCDMVAINNFNLPVMEDAAHCMPSKIGAKWVGETFNLVAFSFYATKNMTTGEGGMLTGDPDLIARAKQIALHGMDRAAWNRFGKGASFEYDVPAPGYKYNMTDIVAGIGLVQLRRLNELFEKRMTVVRHYDESFRNSKFLKVLKTRNDVQSSHHLYVILLDLERLTIDRERFFIEMHDANIGCSVHYKPIHMMSYYAKKYGWKPESFPNAYAAYQRMLSLPLSSKMTLADAQDVVEAVQSICQKYER